MRKRATEILRRRQADRGEGVHLGLLQHPHDEEGAPGERLRLHLGVAVAGRDPEVFEDAGLVGLPVLALLAGREGDDAVDVTHGAVLRGPCRSRAAIVGI
jgi:hypothetical protein